MDVQRTGVTEVSAMDRVRHIQMGAAEIFIKVLHSFLLSLSFDVFWHFFNTASFVNFVKVIIDIITTFKKRPMHFFLTFCLGYYVAVV